MHYARIFPALDSFDPDLSFFHVEAPDTPPSADDNMGDEAFIRCVEVIDLTDHVECVSL